MRRNIVLGGVLPSAVICCLVCTSSAMANPISVKLTSEALGLGGNDINAGHTVDPDFPGALVTSPTVGMGSILTVQQGGLAGPGNGADPLFVTITAMTRLDTLHGLPGTHDYQAGVLYISGNGGGGRGDDDGDDDGGGDDDGDGDGNNGDGHTPGGRKEGLGVRAFTVDGLTGLRTFNGGLANIEGSKDVSGGTGPDTFDPSDPNGAPHVDELVNFEYAVPVIGQSIEVLLTDFDTMDIIDLHVETVGGPDIDLEFRQTTDATLFEEVGNKLWKLTFNSATIGLGPDDLVSSFQISADDDDPSNPRGTAEHFLITGMTAVVPEPAALSLLGLGGLLVLRRRR